MEIHSPRNKGKLLDASCAGGRRGSTQFIVVTSEISAETRRVLNITGGVIPTGTASRKRNKILETPQYLPVVEFKHSSQASFWAWARNYGKQHADDSAPRLFAVTDANQLPSMLDSKQRAMQEYPEEEALHMDLPLYVRVSTRKKIQDTLQHVLDGEVHGIFLQDDKLYEEAIDTWQIIRDKTENPRYVARPFFGLEGSIVKLTQSLENHPEYRSIDTLIITDVPTYEQAQALQAAQLRNMKKKGTPSYLHCSNRDDTDVLRVGIVNVQGSARYDACTLLEASDAMGIPVTIGFIENVKQFEDLQPDALMLPGGWHGLQHRMQSRISAKNDKGEQQSLNELIIQEVQRGKHLLALCAGSILGRQEDQGMDRIKSVGCEVGTGMGLGPYKVVNNTFNTPQNIHLRIETYTTSQEPSKLLHNVPLSNAPYFVQVDEENWKIIARIQSEVRAHNIDEDDGPVVGLMLKQQEDSEPVIISAAFHAREIMEVFLIKVALCRLKRRLNTVMLTQQEDFRNLQEGLASSENVV